MTPFTRSLPRGETIISPRILLQQAFKVDASAHFMLPFLSHFPLWCDSPSFKGLLQLVHLDIDHLPNLRRLGKWTTWHRIWRRLEVVGRDNPECITLLDVAFRLESLEHPLGHSAQDHSRVQVDTVLGEQRQVRVAQLARRLEVELDRSSDPQLSVQVPVSRQQLDPDMARRRARR